MKGQYSAIEAVASTGAPAEVVVARTFPGTVHAGQEERAVRAIPLLRAARVGIFAR